MKPSDLEEFADALKERFSLPGPASAEDQLKEHVRALLNAAAVEYGLNLVSQTEATLSALGVRPDIAIYVDGLICGYVELKAPGLGANAARLTGRHNKDQWQKLKALPNLIYTDGREWSLYRNGARPNGQPLVRLHGDPIADGRHAIGPDDAENLARLLRDFLGWGPVVPHLATPLAQYLAPLTRFLRDEVEVALAKDGSAVGLLANEWRDFFFPDADDAQFADAYAQTVTYAMLLARLHGATSLDVPGAAAMLDSSNGLLARTLELLGQDQAYEELRVGFDLLKRSLEALDPHDFLKTDPDIWLYFYEDFLAAYDPKLRGEYGVYYTPREVVELQVRLASELLENRFGKMLGFADDGVVFLDPAVGTGTYPVAAIKHGLQKVRDRSGAGAVPARAQQMAGNMHGFEILVGPYAVAHLRLTQALEGAINEGTSEGSEKRVLANRLNIYLADTLESPNASPPGGLNLTHRALTQEHEAARSIKNSGDILVCLGNPPYNRQNIDNDDAHTRRKGGWVRFGDAVDGGADQTLQGEEPILTDFTRPASDAGAAVHLKNLYNDYIYFWRWSLWRLFEQQQCGGVITFITASSYLAGPGFVGVREVMRRTFDELWIIDLGGDNLGTRKTPNVFNIQTPVAIAIGVRESEPQPDIPATVRYARVEAESRKDKLEQLDSYTRFDEFTWSECPSDWHSAFLPVGTGAFFEWPTLEELFPWIHSGVQFKRSWPIGETLEVLERRFNHLKVSETSQRRTLFKESRDRKITWRPGTNASPSIYEMTITNPLTSLARYAYRSFDRQYAIVDSRVGDFLRPALLGSHGPKNIYLTSLMTEALGKGPALTACCDVPDLHHYCGRGGKDIIPLYRDAEATSPNITGGLLEMLGAAYGFTPSPEELAAYVYAMLGGQSYTQRFWNELETSGPRAPVTIDGALFRAAAGLGGRLIWLHTWAERFNDGPGDDERGNEVPQGSATTIHGVSSDPAQYPESFAYNEAAREISVGDGRFGPVAPEIWKFEVSGLMVVQSWLGYRMKVRKGRKSSPLDDIRPESWTPAMSDRFLELLWVLEATLAMELDLVEILDRVIEGSCFNASELPIPTEAERRPPEPDTETSQPELL